MQARRATPPSTESPHIPQVAGESKEPKVQEWEYEVLSDLGKDMKDKLNDLGKQGWILTATEPAFIFRRPRQQEPEKLPRAVGFGANRD
ncbi:MAG: hypothetical protein FJZ00_06965 [Candidatus Sericytochromatia bacterium]|jgi:hypothetical protein|uniref:DUF4177 domain-containing protein n=1 Tax=Candidatus Tanganyikabacteria bacterium TaxID=2961651 RepID=A0A937X641_9BACT|nr:hypothetical protein [Candidatus Tanganyikabacteria bacterium]